MVVVVKTRQKGTSSLVQVFFWSTTSSLSFVAPFFPYFFTFF